MAPQTDDIGECIRNSLLLICYMKKLIYLLFILTVVHASEIVLDEIPLHERFGPFSFYWAGSGEDFILRRGNGLMLKSKKSKGVTDVVLFERENIIYERKMDDRGKSVGASNYVINKSGEAIGVYEDTDGDGIYDFYMDFITKKKFSLKMVEQ